MTDDPTYQLLCDTGFCPWNWQSEPQWRDPGPDDPRGRPRCGYCGRPLSGGRTLP